jgi:hypothetical protein
MANLTKPYDIALSEGDIVEYPVVANATIYAGAFVVIDTNGWATRMVGGTANQKFVGVALETCLNSGGANGEKRVKVLRKYGAVVERIGSSLTQASVGAVAYAADDNNITTTAGTNTAVGRITEFISATLCRVAIQPSA